MDAFCNGGNAIYEYTDTYLKFISGVRTLVDPCSIALSQETRFFNIVQPWSVDSDVTPKIFYEIVPDQAGLLLWTDENEKLFFTKATLSVDKYSLSDLVKIYPNPVTDYLQIKSNNIEVKKVSIFDYLGKRVLMKTNNFDVIHVSHLSKGIYFVKIDTNHSSLAKKIILK